jgi:hypothetical protein
MALRKIFGSGVPAYALIDERGTVLAATPQLRGPEFERVLSRLDEPRKPK